MEARPVDSPRKFNPDDHLLNLAGKGQPDRMYMETKWRLVWFRQEHPDWGIETQLIRHDTERKEAEFRAVVTNEHGRVIASGHCCERQTQRFADYYEKAETQAIGRALAAAGFGTQFAPDLEESTRVVDSPIDNSVPRPTPANGGTDAPGAETCGKCGAGLTNAERAHAKQFKHSECAKCRG